MSSPKPAESHRDQSPSSPSDQPTSNQWGAGAIEVDTDDAESSYSQSLRVSDTSSLRSSILNYKWKHGRRYHAFHEGLYWGPNDEQQQDAEDMMHEVHRIILEGKLFYVPVKDNVRGVLDVGCGTGLWAIEFADEYATSKVIGVDLSPIQPTFVPPNCRFEVDDINGEWTYPEDNFDFVHIRGLTGCVPDWVEFHKKVLRHLRPGGWVEQIELSCISRSDDGTIKPDSPLIKWQEVFSQMGDAMGKTFFACEKSLDAIDAAGFINLRERRIKLPMGTWPKDKQLKQWGAWNRQFVIQGLEGFSLRGLTELLGWPLDEAQVFLDEMRKEVLDPNVHAYVEMRIVGGQKPDA